MATDAARQGAVAEAAALDMLLDKGLRLLARNVGYRVGELDLIMEDAGTVVFVEVRQRRHTTFGGAGGSIDSKKQRRLMAAAHLWLAAHPARAAQPCRFDVVLVDGHPPQFRWLPAALEEAST